MVVLDGVAGSVRPARLWNDTESATDAAWLLGRLAAAGRRGPRQRVACRWPAHDQEALLAAPQRARIGARLTHVVLPHDWLTSKLTGRSTTDHGDASGTGYWSPSTGAYRLDLLALVDGDRDWSASCRRCSDRRTRRVSGAAR